MCFLQKKEEKEGYLYYFLMKINRRKEIERDIEMKTYRQTDKRLRKRRKKERKCVCVCVCVCV